MRAQMHICKRKRETERAYENNDSCKIKLEASPGSLWRFLYNLYLNRWTRTVLAFLLIVLMIVPAILLVMHYLTNLPLSNLLTGSLVSVPISAFLVAISYARLPDIRLTSALIDVEPKSILREEYIEKVHRLDLNQTKMARKFKAAGIPPLEICFSGCRNSDNEYETKHLFVKNFLPPRPLSSLCNVRLLELRGDSNSINAEVYIRTDVTNVGSQTAWMHGYRVYHYVEKSDGKLELQSSYVYSFAKELLSNMRITIFHKCALSDLEDDRLHIFEFRVFGAGILVSKKVHVWFSPKFLLIAWSEDLGLKIDFKHANIDLSDIFSILLLVPLLLIFIIPIIAVIVHPLILFFAGIIITITLSIAIAVINYILVSYRAHVCIRKFISEVKKCKNIRVSIARQ